MEVRVIRGTFKFTKKLSDESFISAELGAEAMLGPGEDADWKSLEQQLCLDLAYEAAEVLKEAMTNPVYQPTRQIPKESAINSPPPGVGSSGTSSTRVCPIHNVDMQQRVGKNGNVFYSPQGS